ncbi:MAG: PQQ-binding-like beta-propeller repeat protein [Lentisphaerae bacterium]|nr:PQQ-binding-like beta-propeller repeat protein [Lentisphaerota bacterium]
MRAHAAALAVWMALVTLAVTADDWPQWRGPRRDGISSEKGLLTEWPEGGPRKLWSVSGIGHGFSTVAVVGDRLYTTGIIDGQGHLVAISADGRILGKASYGSDAVKAGGHPGSRSTPTVSGGSILVMSGSGVLTCFDQASGKPRWQVDTFRDFGGRQLTWDISESVLVDGDRVLCTPGGPEALVVALSLDQGKVLWRTRGLDCKSAYCSPFLVQHGPRRLLLTMVEFGAVGIDADNGRLLWQHAHKNRYAVHATTPLYLDGSVIISSGYGHGTERLDLSKDGSAITPPWHSKALDNHHGGVILYEGSVYGTNDRGLVCLDPQSGEARWAERRTGKGSLTIAEGLIYAYSERGPVTLLKPGAQGAEVRGTFQVTEGAGPHWAHPVVANGRLYLRHGDVLMAYDIRR